MRNPVYRPDLKCDAGRAAIGAAVAAAAAAVATVLLIALPVLLGGGGEGWAGGLAFALLYGLPMAFGWWALGILTVGGPVWAVLHRLGSRGPAAAALAGAGAPLLALTMLGGFGLQWPAIAYACAGPGALAGWIVQRIAYAPGRGGESGANRPAPAAGGAP